MNDDERKKVLADMTRRLKANTEAREEANRVRPLDAIISNVDKVNLFLDDIVKTTDKFGEYKKEYGFSSIYVVDYWNNLFKSYGLDVVIPSDNKTRCTNMASRINASLKQIRPCVEFGFRNNPKNLPEGFYGKFYSDKPVKSREE